MKRFLLPLMAISIALVSCSRDNDDVINNPITNPINENVGTLPTKIGEQNITYNGDQLHQIGNDVFTYTGDLITKIVNEKLQLEINYFYFPDGKLKASTLGSLRLKDRVFVRYYTYNNDETIKVEWYQAFIKDGQQDVDQFIRFYEMGDFTYTMKNGNLYKEEANILDLYRIYGGPRVEHHTISTFEYDTQNTPYKKIKGLSALALELYFNYQFDAGDFSTVGNYNYTTFNNNITRKEIHTTGKKHTKTGYGNYSESAIITNRYEYNSAGFPIRQSMSSNDGTATTNSETTYTYK